MTTAFWWRCNFQRQLIAVAEPDFARHILLVIFCTTAFFEPDFLLVTFLASHYFARHIMFFKKDIAALHM